MAKAQQFEPQVRFNWGFHAGAEAKSYLYSHADKYYLAGHNAGFNGRSSYDPQTSLSADAWQTFKEAN